MARTKFPRIQAPPRPSRTKTYIACVHCGKGLGTCRGGWCPRCVQEQIDATTPKVEDVRQANEMLGRKAFSGTHSRRLDLPSQENL